MEIIHIFDQRPGHSNQGNILLESLVNELNCTSSEYSIDNLDKLKVLAHCIGLPIFFFDPEPTNSIGIFDL